MALSPTLVGALVGAGVIAPKQGAGAGNIVSTLRIGMNYQDFNTMGANKTAFETMIGGPVQGVHVFGADNNGWTNSVTDWAAKIDRAIADGAPISMFNMPLTVSGFTLADVAAGLADQYLKTIIAKALTAETINGRRVVRLGWENNETFMPWSSLGKEADYIAAFRHVVDLCRAQSSSFKFVYCPNPSTVNNAFSAYPGDAYVDAIGTDIYLITQQAANPDIADAWFYKRVNIAYGSMEEVLTFAAAHGKELMVAEWGVDNALGSYYVQMMARFCRQHGVTLSMYWDKNTSDPLFQDRLSNNQYPNVATAFAKEFGPTITVTTPTAIKGSTQHDTFIPLESSKTGKLTWSLVGSPPAGVSIAGRGLLVGASVPAGTYSITVRATDEQGYTGDKTFTLTQGTVALTAFAPNSFTGLVAWWDPKVFASLTVSGGRITAVTDRSGSGKNLSQGTFSNQPLYAADDGNGRAAAQFVAVNFSRLDFASIAGIPYGQAARTLCAALKSSGAANGVQKTLLGACDAANAIESELDHKGGYLLDAISGTATLKTGQANANAYACLVSTKGAAASAGGRAKLTQYLDGLKDGTLDLTVSTVVPTKMLIGGRPTAASSTNHADWSMQELFIYSRELEGWEATVVAGYLAWANNGVDRLPPDHPFRTTAPRIFF